ncbi:MYCBP-associated protein [Gouania willdenowi]|uniref:MYCBP-associated protein n=1 Tax=Gouania willdenowi TaxID=441366 RepID=UPI0010541E68|nr:MYCBP-associated protein [Gouania willdenowi]
MERDTSAERLSGLQHLQFDSEGMLLPHTILGSVEDFRSHLEVNGLTDRPVRDPGSEVRGQPLSEAVEKEMLSALGNKETNALQHWGTQMRQRRKQQNILSDKLNRPVKNLLMYRDNHCRETQEKRDLLNQTLPFIQPGYNSHVGCEFWSLPQHLGDELSGITSTLTQTEQGRREPVTYVGQPNSIRQETGPFCTETLQPESRAQHQSSYLQQQFERAEELLQEMDTKRPDLSELEVIGSAKPSSSVTVCHSPSMEKEKETECQEKTNENVDGLVKPNDVHQNALQMPVLRFCGQLASWTGNSAANQGVVGIGGRIIFKVQTGDIASEKMELHNEGSTVIFFSWQKIPVKRTFSSTSSITVGPHFYFNSSGGVINPGDTRSVEFIFKCKKPGIKTEVWQLNTHPILLQGASLQVTLKGIALLKDTTADQRLYLKNKLEKIVVRKTCRAIIDKVLLGVHSPERPSSPEELYLTEEQRFLQRNPKIQFVHQPVQGLKRLWEQVSPGQTWDLSIDSLRQAVLTLPEEKSNQHLLMREEGLSQLNCLFLQLHEPSTVQHRLTARAIGQQMLSNLLDTIADEAIQLRSLLELPQIETWTETDDESNISDSDSANDINKEAGEKPGMNDDETHNAEISRLKHNSEGEPKTPEVQISSKVSKRSRKGEDDEGKITKGTHRKESSKKPADVQEVDPEVKRLYTRLLQQKIYALMEDFVDNLCDLMEEVDTEKSHCS